METLDNLVISLFDSEANKGLFKSELSEMLHVSLDCIQDLWLESEMHNGMLKQYIYVAVRDKIEKENLLEIPFDYIEDGFLVFELEDTIL